MRYWQYNIYKKDKQDWGKRRILPLSIRRRQSCFYPKIKTLYKYKKNRKKQELQVSMILTHRAIFFSLEILDRSLEFPDLGFMDDLHVGDHSVFVDVGLAGLLGRIVYALTTALRVGSALA
jgi:hypothetical protein